MDRRDRDEASEDTPVTQDDLGRRTVLVPLLDELRPTSVLVCRVGPDSTPNATLPQIPTAVVEECTAEELASALEAGGCPDVIWLQGRVNWHTVRSVSTNIASHWANRPTDPPVVVAEGPLPDPVPAWTRNDTYAAQLVRAESSKEGMRLAMWDMAGRVDPDATLLWCGSGRGIAALIPSNATDRLSPWLAGRQAALDALTAAHRENIELVGREFALLEQLEDAQRSANAVVASRRFRIGTRLARLGRKLSRREREIFRAPRQILARQKTVEGLRSQLEQDRDVSEPALPLGALRVTYVLPELRLAGGALVVVELVNELRLLGVDARIATLRERQNIYKTRLLTQPMVFDDVPTMVQELPEADVLVATHWSTVPWVRDLVDAGRAPRAAYFVQDYEPWFYPEDDVRTRAEVRATYELIPHRIVTSTWLRELLRTEGHESRSIPPGLDLGVFYPRPVAQPSRPVVLAMARPRTPRRGFDTVVATLAKVTEAMPSVEIVLFGEKLGGMALPFPYRDEGVIANQDELARLYSRADVHVDGSDFQAFGRAALEAMACGTVSVLTDVGGVTEYARDRENSLLVPPRDSDAAAEAIVTLLRDEELRGGLREEGLASVREFSMAHRARQTLELLQEIAP